jgi:hypothetical protein
MATDVEMDRALAAVSATLNDQKVTEFDRERVQEIVTGALGGEQNLTVDGGGGLHDETGARVGAIRKTPSGEWIVDRQNTAADNSDAAIPQSPEAEQDKGILSKLKPRS